MKLFRDEVVRKSAAPIDGPIMLVMPLQARLLSLVAITVVVAAVVFLAVAPYARKETVRGWVRPDLGTVQLVAIDPSAVREVYVSEGATVRAGDVVALLSRSQGVSAGDSFDVLDDNIIDRAGALDQRSSASRAAVVAEGERLRSARASLVLEIEETRRLRDIQVERLELAEREVVRAEAIAERGFLPLRELELRRSAVLAERQNLSQTDRVLLGLRRQVADTDARLRAIPLELQALAAETRTSEADLERERTETEAALSRRVVSPVDGTLAALVTKPGQAVSAGGAVAIIIPKGSRLQAEIYIPSRAAGFIRKGQEVRLAYEAFRSQTFGTGRGVIDSVSLIAINPRDLPFPSDGSSEPVFRATVLLDADAVTANGVSAPLQPGMLLSAEVIIGRRSLLQWILDPILAGFRRT
jgi:membrane fusion protein